MNMIKDISETLASPQGKDSELLVLAGDFNTDGLTLKDAYGAMSTNSWW